MLHTRPISNAVGNIWKTIEDSRKLMPFVPLSSALFKPPVWRERWKLRSSFNKCSNTFRATLRIAFCATLANTALRSSWNTVAPIRVTPSFLPISLYLICFLINVLTCYDHGASYCPCSSTYSKKVDVHWIDNALEVKWDLNIQNLYWWEKKYIIIQLLDWYLCTNQKTNW